MSLPEGSTVKVRPLHPGPSGVYRNLQGVVQPGPFKTISVVLLNGIKPAQTFWNSDLEVIS